MWKQIQSLIPNVLLRKYFIYSPHDIQYMFDIAAISFYDLGSCVKCLFSLRPDCSCCCYNEGKSDSGSSNHFPQCFPRKLPAKVGGRRRIQCCCQGGGRQCPLPLLRVLVSHLDWWLAISRIAIWCFTNVFLAVALQRCERLIKVAPSYVSQICFWQFCEAETPTARRIWPGWHWEHPS